MRKNIIGIVLTGVAISIALVLFLPFQKKPEQEAAADKIILAAYQGDTGLMVYLAEELGYFQQQGLDVEFLYYETGKHAADALLADEADIATSAEAVLVSNSFAHPELRILSTIAIFKTNGLVVRKDKGIHTLQDLKGKKVGVTRKSAGEYNLSVLLTFNALQMNDVELVDLTPGEIVDAVVEGDIDAGFTWEPNLYNAKKALNENAMIFKDDVPEIRFLLLSKARWLENNPGVAARFIKALHLAEIYIQQHPEETKAFAMERFGYSKEFLRASWQDYRFAIQLPQLLLNILEEQAKWRMESGMTDAEMMPNYLDYIYADALHEVKPDAVRFIR